MKLVGDYSRYEDRRPPFSITSNRLRTGNGVLVTYVIGRLRKLASCHGGSNGQRGTDVKEHGRRAFDALYDYVRQWIAAVRQDPYLFTDSLEYNLTIGNRDVDDGIVERATERAIAEVEAAGEREGLDWEIETLHRSESVEFADACIEAADEAATELGYDAMRMVSGAGHDAVHLTTVCDTGMIFAVSEDGKSHTEAEYTSWEDCYAAANTLANAALALAGRTEAGG